MKTRHLIFLYVLLSIIGIFTGIYGIVDSLCKQFGEVEAMSKWNASVGLTVYIDYDDIEADSREEAEQIAKDRALEDIDYNNCDTDKEVTVYSCYKAE